MTGISYKQCIKMFYSGLIPGIQNPDTLSIYLENPDFQNSNNNHNQENSNKAIIYARVSSSQNKNSLDGQIERCNLFAAAKGLTVIDSKTEIASGLNEDRRVLWSILNRDDFDVLIVEHKDRLTRFGYNFIEAILVNKGKKILIINEQEQKSKDEELMNDFVSIVTSFCSRIYGRKRKLKTQKIIEEITNE